VIPAPEIIQVDRIAPVCNVNLFLELSIDEYFTVREIVIGSLKMKCPILVNYVKVDFLYIPTGLATTKLRRALLL
jgi:hypothetical protein